MTASVIPTNAVIPASPVIPAKAGIQPESKRLNISRPLYHRMRLEKILIHFNSNPRRLQRPYRPILIKLERRTAKLIPEEIVLRDIRLEVPAVIDRAEKMHARSQVDPRHRRMRIDLQLMRGSHRRDPQALRDAA